MVTFGPYTDGYYDTENQLSAYLGKKAEAYFAREDAEKRDLGDREAFEQRRARIRAHFLDALGGLPEEKTPLEPVCVGTVEREGYRIEKIVFQSQPRFYVTSNLYVPTGLTAKAPAVLFVCGHSEAAKAYELYQKVCLDLVRNGFVVLAIDPLGQGERLQYWNPGLGKSDVSWGTREHSYEGFQCTLIGSNVARYFVWDGIRGMDYLMSRGEVDASRIGVTGNSGGGTQTSYLMMADPRIAAAMPCGYITSREAYMKTGQPHDAEQNIFDAIREGLNYDDFITCFAPKPAQIGAAAYDFFCIEGTLQTYERAKAVYRLFDAEDKVSMVTAEATHAYSDALREGAVNWFRRHLMGKPPDFQTGEIAVEAEETLWCTTSGQVIGDYPKAATVFDLNRRQFEARGIARPCIRDADALAEYVVRMRAGVRQVLDIPDERPVMYPRVISEERVEGMRAEKIFFFSEPDVVLTAIMLADPELKSPAPATLLLLEKGTEDIPEEEALIKRLVSEGRRVLVLDVRGIGGVKMRQVNSQNLTETHGSEFKLNFDAMMMGKSLMGLRVFDVLRGYDYLASRKDVDRSRIGLYGRGTAALYGFFAATLEPGFRAMTCEDMLYAYENLARTRLYHERYNQRILVHGLLRHFDLVDLLPCLSDREVRFVRLRDARDEVVDAEALERGWFDVVRAHYPVLGDIRQWGEW